MPQLDAEGRRLLAYLAHHLRDVVPGDPRSYVSYKRVHADLKLSQHGPTFGISLRNQGLDAVAVWARDAGLPAITGLVVSEGDLQPAPGFEKLLGHPDNFESRWKDEIERAKATDWQRHLDGMPDTSMPVRKPPVPGSTSVWRLKAYHDKDKADEVADEMMRRGVIAIGWSDTGDLDLLQPHSSDAIGERIRQTHADNDRNGNSHTGGPSLWRLWQDMDIGDLVIIAARGRKCVVEVTGDYYYSEEGVAGYRHLRSAAPSEIDPDELWRASGGKGAQGESLFWTLARLSTGGKAAGLAYEEGERFEVRSTAVERNPLARKACIAHYGAVCYACEFDFSARYGTRGAGYIHVHHRKAIASSTGRYVVDPIKDLIPLCPNCHAMVHQTPFADDVEHFKAQYWKETLV